MAAAKTVVRYRNRPKKKVRRKNKVQLPIAIIGPTAMIAASTYGYVQREGLERGAKHLVGIMTGYSNDPRYPRFDINRLKEGAIPLLIGVMVHKIAGKIGVNRAISRAGIPWVRV